MPLGAEYRSLLTSLDAVQVSRDDRAYGGNALVESAADRARRNGGPGDGIDLPGVALGPVLYGGDGVRFGGVELFEVRKEIRIAAHAIAEARRFTHIDNLKAGDCFRVGIVTVHAGDQIGITAIAGFDDYSEEVAGRIIARKE